MRYGQAATAFHERGQNHVCKSPFDQDTPHRVQGPGMVNYLARPVGMTVPQILYNKLLYQVSFRDFCWGEVLTVCSRKAVLFRFFYRKKKRLYLIWLWGELNGVSDMGVKSSHLLLPTQRPSPSNFIELYSLFEHLKKMMYLY